MLTVSSKANLIHHDKNTLLAVPNPELGIFETAKQDTLCALAHGCAAWERVQGGGRLLGLGTSR